MNKLSLIRIRIFKVSSLLKFVLTTRRKRITQQWGSGRHRLNQGLKANFSGDGEKRRSHHLRGRVASSPSSTAVRLLLKMQNLRLILKHQTKSTLDVACNVTDLQSSKVSRSLKIRERLRNCSRLRGEKKIRITK